MLFFMPGQASEDRVPPNLDYWRKIVEGGQPLGRPEGEEWHLSNEVKTFNEYDGKRILSFIRDGDYTHAGEHEALDLILSYISKNPNQKILDVACGMGGSADYFHKKGYGCVTGFDIDENAINYAKQKYRDINFFIADALHVSNYLGGDKFDIICIINSLVCFRNQLLTLRELKKFAHSETQLVIYDFSDPTSEDTSNPLTGQGKSITFLPIRTNKLPQMLHQAGWKIKNTVNLDREFIGWYKKFLARIDSKEQEIDAKFGKNATKYVKGKYNLIYYGLQNGWLGGLLVIAIPE